VTAQAWRLLFKAEYDTEAHRNDARELALIPYWSEFVLGHGFDVIQFDWMLFCVFN
jgi:hypothetical protein